jgi:regulator of sigma E protease
MSIIFSIAIFLLVLGALIFFHELGHFVAAKACGIYVDRFSLGMPPRIAGIKIGETDYCIGALPIGGFVKMAGQEDAPLSDEERERDYGNVPEDRWFNKKPVWQRVIVIVAGPFMNVVLAVLLYAWLVALGAEVPEWETNARVGEVQQDMPAAQAPLYLVGEPGVTPRMDGEPDAIGWQTGDVVKAIDGKPVDKFADILFNALLGGHDREYHVLLQRPTADGATVEYVSRIKASTPEGEEFPRFGIAHFSTPVVNSVIEAMPAVDAGIEVGDIIVRANGAMIDTATFIDLVENTPQGETIDLLVERDGETVPVTITPETVGRSLALLYGVDSADEEDRGRLAAEVFGVDETALPEGVNPEDWIQRKDQIVAVNDQPVTFEDFEEAVRRSPGETLTVTVERPAILFGLVQQAGRTNYALPVDAVRAIGVTFSPRMVEQRIPASQIIPEAFEQSYEAIALVVRTLKALAMRDVSPSNLGGPLMIASATTQAAEEGLPWLLRITAFISINLAIFNLLPLPVLDGGLLVLSLLEAIRRKPLSVKLQERFQMVGFFLIIFLMVFVTYHDIRRWVEDLIP